MTSPRITLKAFIDAAADAVARDLAAARRETQRDRELQNAEFRARLAELDTRLSSVANLERRLDERLSALRDGAPGRDGVDGKDGRDGSDGAPGRDGERGADGAPGRDGVDGENGRDGVDGKDGRDGSDGAPGRDGADGRSVEVDDLIPLITAEVDKAVSIIPAPKDGAPGRDADFEAVRAIVAVEVAAAVSTIPAGVAPECVHQMVADAIAAIELPKDGKDADPDVIRAMVADAVAALPPAERGPPGEPGPMGVLQIAKAWTDRVHYAGDVAAHDGATWQATCDTGHEPGQSDDWICLARAGRDGADGRSFTVQGTFVEDKDYCALDVVALNGAAFVARRDNPGSCPGDGWQMIAAQGKRGQAGERGLPGAAGSKGAPGPAVIAVAVDAEGLLTLTNADGSVSTCDLYPLLAKLDR